MEKVLNNKTLTDISVEFRKELTGSEYSLDALRRIYLHTNVSEHFSVDNPSKSDIGSGRRIKRRKYHHMVNCR